MPAYSQRSSSRTCTASSRVGTITSAIGFGPWGTCVWSAASSESAIAAPKATVLPEPVCDDTSRSRPALPASSTAACTPVGVS